MKCQIILKPFWGEGNIEYVEVEYRFDILARGAGENCAKLHFPHMRFQDARQRNSVYGITAGKQR